MEPNVFTATVAGLIHDLWKLEAWAVAGGGRSAGELRTPQEIAQRIASAVGSLLDEDKLSSAAKELVERHGDAVEAPPHPPALVPVGSLIQIRRDGQMCGPSRNARYLKPVDVWTGELRDALFPSGDPPAADDYHELSKAFWELWDRWVDDLRGAVGTGPNALAQQRVVHSLIGLLARFTCGVPASAGVEGRACHIPLFEHLRLTAAIGAATAAAGEADSPLLLVVGDTSGIQQFIYQLQRRGMEAQIHLAKRMRGRSFYLAALSRALALWVAHICGMSEVNVIIAAGGNFQVLVPNTELVREKLETARRDVNTWMLEKFSGRLALALGWVEATGQDMENPGAVASDAMTALAEQKLRKFALLDRAAIRSAISREISDECDSCGVGLVEADKRTELVEPDREITLCPVCVEARDAGAVLPNSRYVCWGVGGEGFTRPGAALVSPVSKEPVELDFGPAGKAWLLSEASGVGDAVGKGLLVDAVSRGAASSAKHCCWWPVATHVAAVKDDAVPFWLRAESDGAVEIKPQRPEDAAARDWIELKPGDMLPFDVLAVLSRGDALLGVLRMDADWMGRVFSEGLASLPDPAVSGRADRLAAFMTLSRQLDMFFAAWVDHLAREEFHRARKRADEHARLGGSSMARGELQLLVERIDGCLYIAYAGGDDLFVAGPWSEVVEVAAEIEADYGEYMCGNPAMTLSAGLLVTKPKAPIYMLANAAEELEEESKERGRSRITVFSTTVPWRGASDLEVSFNSTKAFADVLTKAVLCGLAHECGRSGQPRKLPRGFLHLLLRLSGRAARAGAPHAYVPFLVWHLARNVKKLCLVVSGPEASSPGQSLDAYIKERLVTTVNAGEWMKAIRLPASIALSLTRRAEQGGLLMREQRRQRHVKGTGSATEEVTRRIRQAESLSKALTPEEVCTQDGLAHRVAQELGEDLNPTQLRRFFAPIKGLCVRVRQGRQSPQECQTEIVRLVPMVAYAAGRRRDRKRPAVFRSFAQLMMAAVDPSKLKTAEDWTALEDFVTALVGWHKYVEAEKPQESSDR